MSSEVIEQLKEKMEQQCRCPEKGTGQDQDRPGVPCRCSTILRLMPTARKMPLNQVGTLTIPESRMIAIQPWDPQMLAVIEKAILFL